MSQFAWQSQWGSFEIAVGDYGVKKLSLLADAREPVEATLAARLDDHLAGRPTSLQLDLDGVGPLAQLVLAKLLEIPRGEVRPYAWVAREVGHPGAVRAVASAIARNPIPVLIPCHRVITSDGRIGEFSLGGPDAKQRFLRGEGLAIERLEEFGRKNIRFLSTDDGNFHLPSCARAVEAGDSVGLLSNVEKAHDERLVACTRCKP